MKIRLPVDRAGILQCEKGLQAHKGAVFSRGFADVVFLPLPAVKKPTLVVELKYDRTVNASVRGS
ncbi:MAG: hypothetical protein HFH89_06910 [Lachnospiraceae bacterium]|nr:hypothetical protein [Lachnospiraceae bacterium]